jgi:hypothetical protein
MELKPKFQLPNVAPLSLLRSTLAANGKLCFEAVATEGDAIFDTLKAIIQRVVSKVQGRFEAPGKEQRMKKERPLKKTGCFSRQFALGC